MADSFPFDFAQGFGSPELRLIGSASLRLMFHSNLADSPAPPVAATYAISMSRRGACPGQGCRGSVSHGCKIPALRFSILNLDFK
jgi:hypothetical protein